jgi:hypothetical protein
VIRPHFDVPSFFKVFREDCSCENNQKNIIAYDGNGSVDCSLRSNVEGKRAIRGVWSYYFIHYANETASGCSRVDTSQDPPENALRRLYK